MGFIIVGGNTLAFAEYEDVTDRDQRLFEANEGIANAGQIEDFTERATTKILYLIKDTDWWKNYYLSQSGSTLGGLNPYQTVTGRIDVPPPDANKFLLRRQDWTDVCVYMTLYEYVLPKIADFSNEDNAEYKKIGFYREKFDKLFAQLIEAGDWYDWDGTGTIVNSEKAPTVLNLVRRR